MQSTHRTISLAFIYILLRAVCQKERNDNDDFSILSPPLLPSFSTLTKSLAYIHSGARTMTGGLTSDEANAVIANLFETYTNDERFANATHSVQTFNQEPDAFSFAEFISASSSYSSSKTN
jgi:hypothetical protein